MMPIDKIYKNSQTPESDVMSKSDSNSSNGSKRVVSAPKSADIKRLAQDLMKTHGQKFESLFGTAFFGSKVFQEEDLQKKRQDRLKQKGPIQRILVSSENDIRNLVKECLDSIYQKEEIIEALTAYLCNHYEMLYETSLPKDV